MIRAEKSLDSDININANKRYKDEIGQILSATAGFCRPTVISYSVSDLWEPLCGNCSSDAEIDGFTNSETLAYLHCVLT